MEAAANGESKWRVAEKCGHCCCLACKVCSGGMTAFGGTGGQNARRMFLPALLQVTFGCCLRLMDSALRPWFLVKHNVFHKSAANTVQQVETSWTL